MAQEIFNKRLHTPLKQTQIYYLTNNYVCPHTLIYTAHSLRCTQNTKPSSLNLKNKGLQVYKCAVLLTESFTNV